MKEVMSKKTINSDPLDIENLDKGYLDEKELFLLFSLLRRKHISTMWSNLFTSDIEEKTKSRKQSSIVVSYLLWLGKQLDEKGFSVHCNADYSLLEGGFLTEHIGDIVSEYLADTGENRKKAEKYNVLNKEQKDFLENVIKNEDFYRGLSNRVEFTKLEHPPVEAYREAILNKKADKDFIDLVDKLVTEDKSGHWDTEDTERFLEIYYRHNKEEFKRNAMSERTFLYKDYQTKLADLIFENADIRLSIKDAKKLEDYLSQYINRFVADELDSQSKHGLTQNFFSKGLITPLHTKMFGVKKQRDILIKHIEKKHSEYQRADLEIGHPFIEPRYIGDDKPERVRDIPFEENKEKDLFLFVHTMITLEYENYLDIEGFSYGTTGVFDLYDRGFFFKIKLKNNKKIEVLRPKLYESYDKKYHLLRFAGEEIELAKKGKETDAVLLLEALIGAKNGEWKHNDEILEDWGYNLEDQEGLPKNKVYFAGQKINNAVARKTQIDDFIECNTAKARINPKYLRVDG